MHAKGVVDLNHLVLAKMIILSRCHTRYVHISTDTRVQSPSPFGFLPSHMNTHINIEMIELVNLYRESRSYQLTLLFDCRLLTHKPYKAGTRYDISSLLHCLALLNHDGTGMNCR